MIIEWKFEMVVNTVDTLKIIGQYDVSNNLVKEFICKYDCIKSLKISDKTLTKALDKNIMYNGHYYRSIGSKLSYK
jgi:proline dehydrogenase